MAFEDKTLVCKECGKEFTFTAGEQEFYAEKGFENEPARCRDCRDKRRRTRDGGEQRQTDHGLNQTRRYLLDCKNAQDNQCQEGNIVTDV